MKRFTIPILLVPALLGGCATRTVSTKPVNPVGTLAELRNVKPDVQDIKIEQGLDQAMHHYRRFLEETPETMMTPEAMRRLADLQLEKQFGIRAGDTRPKEMALPQPAQALAGAQRGTAAGAVDANAGLKESDQDFERRTTAEGGTLEAGNPDGLPEAVRPAADTRGPLEAIALYEKLLTQSPSYADYD